MSPGVVSITIWQREGSFSAKRRSLIKIMIKVSNDKVLLYGSYGSENTKKSHKEMDITRSASRRRTLMAKNDL